MDKKVIFLISLLISLIICSTILASVETDFTNLINQERASLGKTPIYINSNLTLSAYLHSKDMAENNFFSHTSLDGRTFDQRIKNAGYTNYMTLGENIAYASGSADANQVFTMWKNSPGHYTNMMGNYKELGLGIYSKNGLTYYTLDLGSRLNFIPPILTNPPAIINTTNMTIPVVNSTQPPITPINITIPPIITPINSTPSQLNNSNLGLTLSITKTSSGYYQFFKINAKTNYPASIYYTLNGKRGTLCNRCINSYLYLRLPLNNSANLEVFAKTDSSLINKTLILK